MYSCTLPLNNQARAMCPSTYDESRVAVNDTDALVCSWTAVCARGQAEGQISLLCGSACSTATHLSQEHLRKQDEKGLEMLGGFKDLASDCSAALSGLPPSQPSMST
ncbi:hypothetical protein EYF80_013524 [Liparis tanakae]|uniref:Uncharacterized protein n=1 Tax=Liparis tanakae TaxID=230148 RepID=A0A4Z2IE39_9TELE|nr:hypothetical protein EYF80_013524 [Liparis tanakae]